MNNKEDSFSEFLKTESFFLLIKPEDIIYSNTYIRNSFFEELEYLKYLRNRLFAMMSDYNYTEMRSFEVDEP